MHRVYSVIISIVRERGVVSRNELIRDVYNMLKGAYSIYTIEKYFYNLVSDGILVNVGSGKYMLSAKGKIISEIIET